MPRLNARVRAGFNPLWSEYAGVLGVVVLGVAGAFGAETPRAAASAPSFVKDVAPILAKNCIGCHSNNAHMGGLVLESYESLMKGGMHGQAIVVHNGDGSRLMQMIEGKIEPRMPFGGNPLPTADIETIRSWINAGAAGPAPGAASPTLSGPAIPSIAPQVPVVSPVASVKFSPDGSTLAVGGFQEVRLFDAASGKAIARLAGHADAVRSIALSPDGKMLAAAGGPPQRGGEIKIWDLETHQLLRTLNGHKDCIYSVAWSPDGKLLASGSYDKAVKLWDASTGIELRTLQDHIDAVFAVAFSPAGNRLASASQDRTVKIWDVATGKRLYTLSDASDGLTSLAYSPSGDQLAAAGYDKTIYVWQLGEDDGHLLHSLIADEDSVLSLVWSHDGKTLVTASSDGSIRFRNPDLDLKGVVDRQPDWVDALDASLDGKWLAAGRYNGSVSLYDLKTYQESRSVMAFDTLKPTGNETTHEAANQ